MPAVNSIISQADYNGIRNSLAQVMSTGAIDYGWGQTMQSSAISVGEKVTINEWAKLRYDILNAYYHIYGSYPTTAQVADGGRIRYTSNFTPDTGTNDVPQYQYSQWTSGIVANRFTMDPAQALTLPLVQTSRSWTYPTTYWTSRISCEFKVTFSSANAARYFFNSGGKIQITSSRTNTSSPVNSQSSVWTSTLSAAGTRSFGGNTPTTGLGTMNGQNWYRLTSSDQVWYSVSSSSPYTANQYRINARCNVSSNSTGTASIGYFLVEFIDNYTDPTQGDPGNPPPDDYVDGNFIASATAIYPAGISVPLGRPDFSVPTPTIVVNSTFSGS